MHAVASEELAEGKARWVAFFADAFAEAGLVKPRSRYQPRGDRRFPLHVQQDGKGCSGQRGPT
jgi:hypothetical protein